jgi:pyrimidine operon attenuation protein/uracil phosphoribosyltransferase
MGEDILHRVRVENLDLDITFTTEVYNEALINIEAHCLVIANKFLYQLGMPSPIRSAAPPVDVEFFREQNYNIEALMSYVQSNIPLLTIEQKNIYDIIMGNVNSGIGDL